MKREHEVMADSSKGPLWSQKTQIKLRLDWGLQTPQTLARVSSKTGELRISICTGEGSIKLLLLHLQQPENLPQGFVFQHLPGRRK